MGRAALLMSALFLAVAPERVTLPRCDEGALLVSTGDGYTCRSAEAFLKAHRTSWSGENLLPECSSGALLESDGFGRWRCIDKSTLMPRCSSGDALRSEGSSGWRCEHATPLPSCSSGEVLISTGSHDFGCKRLER